MIRANSRFPFSADQVPKSSTLTQAISHASILAELVPKSKLLPCEIKAAAASDIVDCTLPMEAAAEGEAAVATEPEIETETETEAEIQTEAMEKFTSRLLCAATEDRTLAAVEIEEALLDIEEEVAVTTTKAVKDMEMKKEAAATTATEEQNVMEMEEEAFATTISATKPQMEVAVDIEMAAVENLELEMELQDQKEDEIQVAEANMIQQKGLNHACSPPCPSLAHSQTSCHVDMEEEVQEEVRETEEEKDEEGRRGEEGTEEALTRKINEDVKVEREQDAIVEEKEGEAAEAPSPTNTSSDPYTAKGASQEDTTTGS